MNHIHRISALGVVVFLALLAAPAWGGASMTPFAQQRAVNSFVIVPPCGMPTTVGDSDSAIGFTPFDSQVHSERICKLAQGTATGDQQSTIESTRLAASGSSHSTAASAQTTVIHAISGSTFQVTFSLDQASTFKLAGQLTADGGLPVVGSNARVRLSSGSVTGATIFESTAMPGPGGSPTTVNVDQLLQLQPGGYTLQVTANSIIDAMVPPAGAGTSTYDMTFNLLDPADLDHDGDVDGMDLASLLAQWGGCPLACICCCPADFDCNGTTDGLDLAQLLAAWSP